jgi:hypothetical protein
MSDNTTLNSGAGGDIVRAVDRGSAKTQVVQLDVGGAGGESLVSATNALPAYLTGAPGGALSGADILQGIIDARGVGVNVNVLNPVPPAPSTTAQQSLVELLTQQNVMLRVIADYLSRIAAVCEGRAVLPSEEPDALAGDYGNPESIFTNLTN